MNETTARIAALADRAREAYEAARLIQQQRDSLIIEAVDREGIRPARVAAAAGISRARVTVILGNGVNAAI